MKAKQISSVKTKPPTVRVVAADEDDDVGFKHQPESVDTPQASVPEPATINEPPPAAASPVVPVLQAATITTSDTEEIVFLTAVDTYPVIGRFSFLEAFGVTTIRRHQKFVVPTHVAHVLMDKGLVTIPAYAV